MVQWNWFLLIKWNLHGKFKRVRFLHPPNNDNFVMSWSEWLDLSTSLSPRPEPQDCLCCTAARWHGHRGSTTRPALSSHPLCQVEHGLGSRNLKQRMHMGVSTAQGPLKLAFLPLCLAQGQPVTGKGHKAPVHCWKGKEKTKQMSGGPLHAVSFQLCLSCAGITSILLPCQQPNRLQHMAALLGCSDRRDTAWCQHKVTHYQSIHPNAHFGSSEISTMMPRYMFKALQLINTQRSYTTQTWS